MSYQDDIKRWEDDLAASQSVSRLHRPAARVPRTYVAIDDLMPAETPELLRMRREAFDRISDMIAPKTITSVAGHVSACAAAPLTMKSLGQVIHDMLEPIGEEQFPFARIYNATQIFHHHTEQARAEKWCDRIVAAKGDQPMVSPPMLRATELVPPGSLVFADGRDVVGMLKDGQITVVTKQPTDSGDRREP